MPPAMRSPQGVGAPERAPHRVGPEQAAPVALEPARDVEEPRPLVGVGCDEADRHAGAPYPPVAVGDREPGVDEHALGELLRAGPVVGHGGRKVRVRRARRFGDAPARDLDVLGIEVVTDVATTEPRRGDERRAAAHERVEHEVVLERVEPDELLGQLDRERRGVADAPRAFRRHVPHVERQREEVVGHQRALVRQPVGLALLRRTGAVEATLARDDDPFR